MLLTSWNKISQRKKKEKKDITDLDVNCYMLDAIKTQRSSTINETKWQKKQSFGTLQIVPEMDDKHI